MDHFVQDRLYSRLKRIYKERIKEQHLEQLGAMLEQHKQQHRSAEKWSEQDIVLITYGDSIIGEQKPLRLLKQFLDDYLSSLFTIIHILPYFPYSSDDGFSVIDFYQVNPDLGDWQDVQAISAHFDLMTDLVINHASSQGTWFQNFLKGEEPGSSFFILCDPEQDYSQVVRPRSLPLLSPYQTKNGEQFVWTTFSADQVDLNFNNPDVLLAMVKALLLYLEKGTKVIRLDAIAFLWKELGTSCLHLPQTHEVVKLLRDIMEYVKPSSILLTETNVPNKENLSYFGEGDEAHMVYQFSLPPLLFHALYSGNTQFLNQWAANDIPNVKGNMTYFNFTASHDGIGVRPLEGLLPDSEFDALLKGVKSMGGFISTRRKPDGSDVPYELNITYYDAMKTTLMGDDAFQTARFLLSQTVMMSMQGVPAFYIHSLLATPNDYEGLEQTGHNRTINRKKYTEKELNRLLTGNNEKKEVFDELLRRIHIRKNQKAFHPNADQYIIAVSDQVFVVQRQYKNELLYCLANFSAKEQRIPQSIVKTNRSSDLITKQCCVQDQLIILAPYQVVWL